MATEFVAGNSRIYQPAVGGPIFAILDLKHLKITEEQEFDTVNRGWIRFIQQHNITTGFERKRSDVLTSLKRRIAYLQRTLDKVADAQSLEKRKQEAELKGHLLQTFVHEIPNGAERVTLDNIFSPKDEKIEIRLNPAKNVHENAKRYFEKFKNIEEQKELLSIKKDTYQDEFDFMQSLQVRAQNATSMKEIDQLYNTLVEKNILQEKNTKQKERENLGYSFNRALLGKKWEIFIGKNAANNDLLTFKFARKYDIWLHAQGVPGSHVVIRKPDRTHNPPEKVIHQAAGIAAHNSDARHASTVPVNYTEVRYVRKPRKAAPGAVTITNEKTIFVKPVKIM